MFVLARLVEQWWWTCPVEVWDQLLMFSAAVFCDLDSVSDSVKGKSRARDDETKQASMYYLKALLRRRGEREGDGSDTKFKSFVSRVDETKILSILGQTLTMLLDTAQSLNRNLQTVSFELIEILLNDYLPASFLPSVLPGVVSAMTKIALGRRENKGWSPGDSVVHALGVMQTIILGAVGDEVCMAEGAIRTFSRLDELNDALDHEGKIASSSGSPKAPSSPFFTPRTSVWLTATASQLNIMINTLSPLLHHPNPIAQSALAQFSYTVLANTARTLPDAQHYLLLYLLSLSASSIPEVQKSATDHLLLLLSPESLLIHHQLLPVLSRFMRDRLVSLPQLIPTHNDTKVEHIAKQIIGACQLSAAVPPISDGIGKLLGPVGGIEKWGWSFLSALQFVVPPFFVFSVRPAVALLEDAPTLELHPFPELNMRFIESRSARDNLDMMFRALGKAAGTEGSFAVEWFVGLGRSGRSSREVGALWCASKLLEGMGSVSLQQVEGVDADVRPAKALETTCRWIAKTIAEFWDSMEDTDVREDHSASGDKDGSMQVTSEADDRLPMQYVKGLNPIVTLFDMQNTRQEGKKTSASEDDVQSNLHKVMALRLLSTVAGILRHQFSFLLLHTLYPILHSLISDDAYVSSTGLATLHYIAFVTGYASPSNLLLANFDYALDGVGRRLDRRNLDPEATKIFVILIRLVGKDIVQRASDVVEACFDRLDEFHGYTAIVEGLVEVLAEVIQAIEVNYEPVEVSGKKKTLSERVDHMQVFKDWYEQRRRDGEEEDYGPVPREDWSRLSDKGKDKEAGEL